MQGGTLYGTPMEDQHAAPAETQILFSPARIIYRCWVDRQPYDEQIHLKSLRAKHSSFLKEPSD